MFAFIVRRLAQAVLVMVTVAFIAFMLFQYVGDPVVFLLGQDATPEQIRSLRADLGLDKPFFVQFWHFLVNAAQGEFGLSLRQGAKVSRLMAERFPATLELALVAAALALLVGVPMGVYAALKRGTFISQAFMTNTLLGDERMKTGEVRESDSRGRHTTTFRALIPLPAGACLIDTPGMRELKPTGEEDLADGGFADIEALAEQCKFRDCSHDREPGCAVRAAIEREELDEGRFLNYLKLRDEVAAAADKLASRLADKANAKVQNKALNKRLTDKYGKR